MEIDWMNRFFLIKGFGNKQIPHFASLILAFVLIMLCAGCMRGLIYYNVTLPLVTNMNKTPSKKRLACMSTYQVKEPVSSAGLSLEWNSRAIGDAAKQAGFSKIYYANMKKISILMGIWKQETILVIGE